MNSKDIKTALFANLRFKKQHSHIASECGIFNSDILTVKKDKLIEIEVKISKADFKNDFKKFKHQLFIGEPKEVLRQHYLTKEIEYYRQYKQKNGRDHRDVLALKYERKFIPNFFYFAVPQKIHSFVVDFLKANYPEYGVILIDDHGIWTERPRIVKKAKKLHNRQVSDLVKQNIALRMGSELANLYIKSKR
jgi:hypothetical protein